MGFFGLDAVKPANKVRRGAPSIELLHRMQCKVCPLNPECASGTDAKIIKANKYPHIQPTGSDQPLIYFLGETPDTSGDLRGEPFAGSVALMLKNHTPPLYRKHVRYNNVVRTRTPDGRSPTMIEIEACRPSVLQDIQETKPEFVFAFGSLAMAWAVGSGNANLWSGRKLPVSIGDHTCWMFPMMHPKYIMQMQNEPGHIGKDLQFTFDIHMRQAFAMIERGLPEPVPLSAEQALSNIDIVAGHDQNDLSYLEQYLEYLKEQPILGFDIETSSRRAAGRNPRNIRPYDGGKIVSAAFSDGERTLAFAVDHDQMGWSGPAPIRELLSDFLHDYRGIKVAHQLSFEMEWCAYNFGKELIWGTQWADTMAQAYVKNSKVGLLGLEDVTLECFGLNPKKLHKLDKENMDREPIDTVLEYNGLDSKVTKLDYEVQVEHLHELGLTDQYERMYIRIPTVTLTQMKGVPIDQDRVQDLREEFRGQDGKLTILEEELSERPEIKKYEKLTGKTFNVLSGPEVKILFNKILEIGVSKVDEPTLSKIKHPVAEIILEHRGHHKNWATYVRPLLPFNQEPEFSRLYDDGMIHPILHTMKVVTTRTSSAEPNEQNYPKHDHKEMRSQMRHPEKKVFSFDYAGMQARNIAMESLDPTLVQAFHDNYDVHADWRDNILRLYPNWMPKKERGDPDRMKYYRQRCKNEFVFPSFFGAQPYSVSVSLGIPEEIVQRLQDDLWGKFPKIYDWHDRLRDQYREHGYVSGLSAFRRYAPVGPNEIINSPIQSDEALIVLTAMAELSQYQQDELQSEMEVHDDLTWWWTMNECREYVPTVLNHMINTPYEWAHVVPIEVELSIGDDWASTSEKAVFRSDGNGSWMQIKDKGFVL